MSKSLFVRKKQSLKESIRLYLTLTKGGYCQTKAKYDGRQTARDCLALYMYVHAYMNGQSEGVMRTKKISWYGQTKKMYILLYERREMRY
ncbi:hypothetical protein WAK64_00935 [Bacillus spongiae]|uniref:Uncharacterized protein n=1 Tax=Bacillus spongiae TaxID=2683610 RepID=A0ABU8H8W7_9BACI